MLVGVDPKHRRDGEVAADPDVDHLRRQRDVDRTDRARAEQAQQSGECGWRFGSPPAGQPGVNAENSEDDAREVMIESPVVRLRGPWRLELDLYVVTALMMRI